MKKIALGFFSKLIHTDNNTVNFLEVTDGSRFPPHQHPPEQSSFVLKGKFEITVGEKTQILTADNFALIPGNVIHGGRAITNCKLVDILAL